jgi:hypothetical protein
MRNLPILAYAWSIIIGALLIFLPSGVHVCIACGSMTETVAGIVSLVIGIAGLATQGRSALSA